MNEELRNKVSTDMVRRIEMEVRVSHILHTPAIGHLDPHILVSRIMQAYDEVTNGKDE